jgi:peptide deformylase
VILPIYVEPSAVLTTPCLPVEEITEDIKKLADDMRETMHNAQGIGLAAPQVGRSIQLCVLELKAEDDEDESFPYLPLINPRITWHSTQLTTMTEACLSIPLLEGPVARPAKVRVKAKDLEGNELEIRADGILARALQHEIDHLHGTLFTSYIPKKALKNRKLVKYPTIVG